MKTVYYIGVTRDDKREFNYSLEVGDKEIEEEEYIELKCDEVPIVILQQPLDSSISIISKDKDCLEACKAGIAFEHHKYSLWEEMYDQLIDFKLQA